VYTEYGANPFREFVHFRAWRVFRWNRPTVISYNQFGVQTLPLKARWLVANAVGSRTRIFAQRLLAGHESRTRNPAECQQPFRCRPALPVGRFATRGAD
jgi:hypothetical protein